MIITIVLGPLMVIRVIQKIKIWMTLVSMRSMTITKIIAMAYKLLMLLKTLKTTTYLLKLMIKNTTAREKTKMRNFSLRS